jgi:chaperonin GroES
MNFDLFENFEILENTNRVLVHQIEDTNLTSGGLHINVLKKELWDDTTYHAGFKPLQGIVVKLGPGKKLKNGESYKFSVKIGDKVLYNMYGTTKFKYKNKDYYSIDESGIIGIINTK